MEIIAYESRRAFPGHVQSFDQRGQRPASRAFEKLGNEIFIIGTNFGMARLYQASKALESRWSSLALLPLWRNQILVSSRPAISEIADVERVTVNGMFSDINRETN
jgi:hypothetical protein